MSQPGSTPAAPGAAESANLDLLRTLAVLFVVAFHLLLVFGFRPQLGVQLGQLGLWGVLIFFVHTSTVLMLSLERQEQRAPGAPKLGEFLLRRAFRVYPLSVLTVVLVVALRLPVGHFTDGRFQLVSPGALGVLSNLVLAQNLTYTEPVVATLWSLPFEMEMYLLLPALFLFSRRGLAPLLGVFAAVCAASFWWLHSPRWDLFELPKYVPCFFAGVIAYRSGRGQPRSLPFWIWPLALALLTLAFLRHPTFAGGWCCTFCLALLIPRCREMPDGALRKGCQLVARYSYGIYLSHFVLIWLAFGAGSALPAAARWAIFLVTLLTVPVALYHFIEAPMIAVGARLAARRRSSSRV